MTTALFNWNNSFEHFLRVLFIPQFHHLIYEQATVLVKNLRQCGPARSFESPNYLSISANAILFLKYPSPKEVGGGSKLTDRLKPIFSPRISDLGLDPDGSILPPQNFREPEGLVIHPANSADSLNIPNTLENPPEPASETFFHEYEEPTPIPSPRSKKYPLDGRPGSTMPVSLKSPAKTKTQSRSQLSFWEYHCRKLQSLMTPLDDYHRSDDLHRQIWLTHFCRNQKYQFKTPSQRLRLQNLRWAFIFAQRKRERQLKNLAQKKLKMRKKRKQKLYKIAYLRFKMGRIGLLRSQGNLRKAIRLGWTADREWKQWKWLLKWRWNEQRTRWSKKRTRKTNYEIDQAQVIAERKMFNRREKGRWYV